MKSGRQDSLGQIIEVNTLAQEYGLGGGNIEGGADSYSNQNKQRQTEDNYTTLD